MTNNPPWGALDNNDKLDLASVKTDVALLVQANDEQNKKLDRIETTMATLPISLSNLTQRVEGLEQDIIPFGKLRMDRIEGLIKSVVVGFWSILGTVGLGVLSWAAAKFGLPYLHE